MSVHVLHLIPSVTGGGGARAPFSAASAASAADLELRHTFVSIRPADPHALSSGPARGTEVLNARPRDEVVEAIGQADVVHLHFWRSPEMIELLESELPAHRLLLWPHVAGHTAPQLIPAEVVSRASLAVGTSERTARSMREAVEASGGESGGIGVIEPTSDWARLQGVERSGRDGFNVGYVGTVGSVKLHDRFAEASAAVRAPGARIIVCGRGDAERRIPRQMAELGAGDRLEMLGQVEEIGPVLADFDVFGYPLRSDTYASSDLVLKEAMYCGVPPVVLADGGSEQVVQDGATGIVAPTIHDYPAAVDSLAADPAERARLAQNARAYASERWSPGVIGPAWADAYRLVMDGPKGDPGALLPQLSEADHPGARRFLDGTGMSADAALGLEGRGPALEIDQRLAGGSPAVGLADGGLLDFRRRYPEDELLALWSGLYLAALGRTALAAAELARARELGCPAWRLEGEPVKAASG